MNIISENIKVLSFAVLINAKAETSAHLLTLTDITAALLESTDLENIRIIPTLTQCGM